MGKRLSILVILLHMCGLRPFIRRLHFLKWILWDHLQAWSQGSAEDPLPRPFIKRMRWYFVRIRALLKLARLMYEYENKKEKDKGNR